MRSLGLVYLASPYSSRAGHERAARAKQAKRAAAILAEAGEVVFCPVAYGHLLDEAIPYGRPRPTHDYWMQLCLPVLSVASRIYVLTLPGWQESLGVREEVALATRLGKPVLGYNPFVASDEDVPSGADIRRLCALAPGWLDERAAADGD
jgi:hypothetical protein